MSTPAQKANLARIRDNQRRSRARKREYLQELEQRLRTCELQGIEASAEVQMAARRVADENRQLRELLHKQGISNEYIAHYLQSTLAGQSDLGPSSPFAGGASGQAVQSLQQLLVPRRPAVFDPNASMSLSGQASRETSIASASTSTSSLWDGPQQGTAPSYGHHHSVNVPPGAMGSTPQFATPIYSAESTPRIDPFTGQQQQQPQGNTVDFQRHQSVSQHLPGELPVASMNYNDPNAPFNTGPRDYGPPRGYC